jgi:hypothetical protein
MDDRDGAVEHEHRVEGSRIENIAFDKWTPAHKVGVSPREVILGDRSPTCHRERLASVAADETGAPSDKNGFHNECPPRRLLGASPPKITWRLPPPSQAAL